VLIAYADGADSPRSTPDVVLEAVGAAGREASVVIGWTPEGRPWLDSTQVTGYALMGGYAVTTAVAEGRLRYVPIRLSAVPRFIGSTLVPDIGVVSAVMRGDRMVYGSTVGWGPALTKSARRLVVEVDRHGPDMGGPPVEGEIHAVIERPPSAVVPPSPRPPDPVEMQVGAHVASVLPEGATIQMGPGGIADAIVESVRRPVSVASGVVSDAVAALQARGLLAGRVRAGYLYGGEPLERLATAGLIDLLPVEVTHDVSAISATDRFVACNTALQVGLDGSVNVETVSGRRVAGIGGHADFCAGAVRSRGGLSVIALRSATRSGTSNIVERAETVSTPRCDVDLVVTEHGVADLRLADDRARAAALIAVAAPEHRDALAAAVGL
jgi:acyl-CoA hydrolase